MVTYSRQSQVEIPDVALPRFVLRQAGEWKDQPALIDGPSGRTLTYGQVAGGAQRLAAGLAQRGFSKGDVFAICLPNVPEYALALLGVTSLGGIVTGANPLYTVDELAYQLNDSGAKYLLTLPQLVDKALAAAKQTAVKEVFVLGEAADATPLSALMQNDGKAPPVSIVPRDDLGVLPYSSGTSGRPKGVMLTHYNLVAVLCQIAAMRHFQPGETAIVVLPFYHILGLMAGLLTNLQSGAKVITLPRFELEPFLSLIEKYKPIRSTVVPPIVAALARHPAVAKHDVSSLKAITCGAAHLSTEIESACAKRLGCQVMPGYGLTETSVATHCIRDDPSMARPGSVGQAIPNVETKIMDPATGAELRPNQPGEIAVRGPNVMRGYLNRPEETAKMLDADGWLHTGDLGYVDQDGYLFIVDRLKELIKYKGYQVAPTELEELLLKHPLIADAAVIASPDAEAGEVPKAFVVLRGAATPEEIMAFVAQRVAPHKQLRRIETVESIPRLPSGKLLRRVLVERERKAAAERTP